jgi:signal transduction histidine kinase
MYSAEMNTIGIEKPIKVLIVEDDPSDVKLVRLVLFSSTRRHEVKVAGCLSIAIERLHDGAFDVVLLDMGLPDSKGIDTVLKVHTEFPDIPIVVLTGLDDEETGIRAVRIGAQDYLVKGDVPATLLTRTIRYAIERKRMEIEKKGLEQKAQIASRLSSVGRLALGIAHEINNPLTSIIGYSQLLMQKDIPEDIKADLKPINDGAQRVASIVDRLLNFTRYHKAERTYININNIATATLDLVAHQLETSNIKVTTQLAPDLPATVADGGQLQQVFLNLIMNAEAEMKLAHGKGELFVKTEVIDNTIRISFQDDGPGITSENMERIFDPFFTTSEIGQGAGLGLSVCHGIITEHGGRVYAQNNPGEGVTFIVELPLITESEQFELDKPASVESQEQSRERTSGR